MNVLMMGKSNNLCDIIGKIRPNYNLYIIEEHDVLKRLSSEVNFNVKKIYEAKYHESDEYMDIARMVSEETEFCMAVPSFEYCVKPSSAVAEYFKIPGIGDVGANICTNKLLLRDFCSKNNIPQPAYREITNIEQLRNFYNNKPIIFKPANRQGSLGVIKITKKEEIDSAFIFTTSVENEKYIPTRETTVQYLAEELVNGKEYSVEVLVKDGKIQFINFTEKLKFHNGFFVESGHIVPGDLEDTKKQKITAYMNTIVKTANIKNTVLHAEWIVNSLGEYIIECAARRPGDDIPQLISNAYNSSFYEAYFSILEGKEINFPQKPECYSGIKFFFAEKGILKDIKGVDSLNDSANGVLEWKITKNKGDIIKDISSSWERVGYFIVSGSSREDILHKMEIIEKNIEFVVED